MGHRAPFQQVSLETCTPELIVGPVLGLAGGILLLQPNCRSTSRFLLLVVRSREPCGALETSQAFLNEEGKPQGQFSEMCSHSGVLTVV